MNTDCLEKRALNLLPRLEKIVTKGGFVLAGGTAAALHLGHLKSLDFDFFTTRSFSTDVILRQIEKWSLPFQILQEEAGTLTLSIDGVKVSFFHYPYRFADEPTLFSGITVTGLIDIASMKLLAIMQRGAKRDFVDLYYILKDIPVSRIADNLVERFGRDRINPVVIGKALLYFNDADTDPDPEYIGKKKDWKEIKRYFTDHVKQIVLDLEAARKR